MGLIRDEKRIKMRYNERTMIRLLRKKKPASLPTETKRLFINRQPYIVHINYLPKKHSSGTFRDNEIILRISSRLSLRERKHHIESLIKKLQARIKKHKRKWDPLAHLFKSSFVHKVIDEEDIYLGELETNNETIYTVYIRKNRKRKTISAKIVPKNRIIITTPDFRFSKEKKEKMKRLIYNVIAKDQTEFIYDLVGFLNDKHFKERFQKITMKTLKSRWGSCSSRKNINLSSRLLFVPLELMEYVCVHELAHLKEMNHSKKFWNWVEKAMPDFKERKKKLRTGYN